MRAMTHDSTASNSNGQEGPKKLFMRPPKVTTIPKEDYERNYWPHLSTVLTQIFANPKGVAYSQEELYRNIYNICCQRHTASLYNDLMSLVTNHLRNMYTTLATTPDDQFIQVIGTYFVNFKIISEIVCAVFRYMDRVYIMEKMNTTLETILYTSLNNSVLCTPEIKNRLENLLKLLHLNADPNAIMHLIVGLYKLEKKYIMFNPNLFAMYIPGLQQSRGIDIDRSETLEVIEQLRYQGFGVSPNNINKRKLVVAETI